MHNLKVTKVDLHRLLHWHARKILLGIGSIMLLLFGLDESSHSVQYHDASAGLPMMTQEQAQAPRGNADCEMLMAAVMAQSFMLTLAVPSSLPFCQWMGPNS